MSEHDVSAEPRDSHGRWTVGGAGADTSSDPRVTDVGGDKWNRETAARLEKEYAQARPAMDAIAKGAEGKTGRVENDTANPDDSEDEFHAGVPQSWDEMSGSQHDEAEQHFMENELSSALENEKDNWLENGEAYGQAATDVAADEDWKHEKIGEFLMDRQERGEPRLPYTVEQLANAVSLSYDHTGSSNDAVEISFDDSELQKPDNAPPPEQMTFPGLEAPDYSKQLPEADRTEMVDFLEKSFQEEASDRASKLDPPDYLEESAKESVADYWSGKSDYEKFEYAKDNGVLPEEDQPSSSGSGGGPSPVHEPNTYDPLNKTDGEDYRRTQLMAHYLFDQRAQQVMADRKIGVGSTSAPPTVDDIRRADKVMWTDWKGSSTSQNGQLMQVASADELGGRLRGLQRPDDATLKEQFDTWKADHPGTALVTFDQFKEDWATVYGPSMAKPKEAIATTGERVLGADGKMYDRLPDISIVRNGLASTTLDAKVANDWGGTGNYAPAGIDREAVIAQANMKWADIGGYEGVKALMRAKWEATQYMLDRANAPTLDVYRGINLVHSHTNSDWKTGQGAMNPQGTDLHPNVQHPVGGHWIHPGEPDYEKHLETLHTAEATVRDVAEEYAKGPHDGKDGPTFEESYNKLAGVLNPDQAMMLGHKYGGVGNALRAALPEQKQTGRVVIRAQVPRTAVLSVPAYGINVHSEKEAVVAGTAWKTWEAYSNRAPTYEEVKPHAPAMASEEVHQQSYKKYLNSFGGDKNAAMSYADWLKVTKPEMAHTVLKK